MILIENGTVLTGSPRGAVLRRGSVVIEGDRIIDVGDSNIIRRRHRNTDRRLDATGKLVCPGLVNGHNHMFQVLMRGLGDGLGLASWGEKLVWPLSLEFDLEDFRIAATLAATEMIHSGVTCCADSHYPHKQKNSLNAVARGVEESGLRAIITRNSRDKEPAPRGMWETPDYAVKECRAAMREWNGKRTKRVFIRPEASSEGTCSLELVERLHDLASEFNTHFHMHIAESEARVKKFAQENKGHPVDILAKLGVLGPRTTLAHCVWVGRRQIRLLAESETKVIHNPVSNQYLADGIAPVSTMLELGITTGLGTDGAASNDSQNMFEVMKCCGLLQKVANRDAGVITSEAIFNMATTDGARAIGMSDSIGSIAKDKKADLTIIDAKKSNMQPLYNPFANLVYCNVSPSVMTTIVDGEILMQDGEVLSVDELELIERVQNRAEAIRSLATPILKRLKRASTHKSVVG